MPLANIKVLDLTRFVAGPFCTLLLADMGADVIKIETPGHGDDARYQGTIIKGESWYFVGMNRNKKGMTLDLKAKEGKEIFLRLVERSDVVVENFRPGIMRNFGLDYETLRKVNPGIIYCGISGFGKDGPYALRPAFDFIAQGISGFMSITGFPDREPVRTGIPISDSVAGIYGAYGILVALMARQHTGKGQGGPNLPGGRDDQRSELPGRPLFRGSVRCRNGMAMITPCLLLMALLRPWMATSTSPPLGTQCGKGWPMLSASRNCSRTPASKPTISGASTAKH